MYEQTIKIGTRKSQLALAQTKLVVEAIQKNNPDVKIELVPMMTQGDKILDKSLESFGGKGAFVSEFEEALLKGKIDLAVHSAKDMPIKLPEGLEIIAASDREDPRDVIITRKDNTNPLTENSIVGTSSLRRQMQIQDQFHVQVKTLRGNVNTRLSKLLNGEYDAIILAAAGLNRIDIKEGAEFNFTFLNTNSFIPAAGQGIIAVEGRSDDDKLKTLLAGFNSINSIYCLQTEREVLKLLNAGCSEPIGVFSQIIDNQIELSIIYGYGNQILRANGKALINERYELAQELTKGMIGKR
ncbi:MAG: porphobilinogen deaminase [Anaerocolumna sp.]|jgi:hydroxymethylbilane synthase|nr:porphobilinogen deaminase [Anaerocolumna sp.]